MNRIGIAGLIASFAVLASAQAKEFTPSAAIRTLSRGQGDELQAAVESLRAMPDLLKTHGKALAALVSSAPSDPDVTLRVMGLVRERGEEGCRFVASLVTQGNSAWVKEVLTRYRALPTCAALKGAVAGILSWATGPASSADAALLVTQALALVGEDRYAGMPDCCRLVLAGPEALRRQAIRTVQAARPPWGDACLIRAYSAEVQAPRSPETVRRDLLGAVAASGGVDAVPTLVLALDKGADGDLACELLLGLGKAGRNGLVFAVRTGEGGSDGVYACLGKAGETAVSEALPLLDHGSARVRARAVDFLSRFRSREALLVLADRFLSGGRVDRATLLGLLVRYPVADVREIVDHALDDPDEKLRLDALEAIERLHCREFSKELLAMAEEDKSPALRRRTMEALWHLGDPAAVTLALRQAQYEMPAVATQAIRVLAFTGDQKAVDVLLPLLKSKEKTVAAAAATSLWMLTYQDPARETKPTFKAWPKRPAPPQGREVKWEGGRATVIGKKGPLVILLPGGPGMDLSWAWPYLKDLADEAVLAFPERVPAPDPATDDGVLSPDFVASAARAVGRPKAILVSHGLGGTDALWIASRLSELVTGVAVLAGPLPGRLQGFDDAIVLSLPEPFKSAATTIVETQALFDTDALNRSLGRVLAPAYAGPKSSAGDVLGVPTDVRRYGRASAVLSRPEVRFASTEVRGRVMFVLPMSRLPDQLRAGYVDAAVASPGTVAVEDLSDCGFLPQATCTSRVVKLLSRFAGQAGAVK